MSRVLVTGASGFIGRALLPALASAGHEVWALGRQPPPADLATLARWHRADMAAATPAAALDRVEVVVHLAGLAHTSAPDTAATVERFRTANVSASVRLAECAAAYDVRRLVFLSSAAVHGPTSGADPFHEDSPVAPVGPYARSKAEAEAALTGATRRLGMELCILRPPLVYGPGVKGNLRKLLRWAASGVPFPAPATANRRNLIGLSNLCDVLIAATTHEKAANETFLLADDDGTATADLFRRLAEALGRRPRLLTLPRNLLATSFRALHLVGDYGRLYGDFRIDATKVRQHLGWCPQVAMETEIARTAARFLAEHAV